MCRHYFCRIEVYGSMRKISQTPRHPISPLRCALYSGVLLLGFLAEGQQDCTLAIGGKDTELIVQLFQLNGEQQAKMKQWVTAMEAHQEELSAKIKELFETHPQKTSEDLETMAGKYKQLQEEMEAASREVDRKMLAIFNPRQYDRYVQLCQEAQRRPLELPENPVVTDSLATEHP